MTNKLNHIFNFLDEKYPEAKCGLCFHNDYELLISVMLSAQTTDNAVNKVTSILYSKYPTLVELDNAPLKDIYSIISSLGLANNKAKNIKGITHELLTKHNGVVPNDADALTSLPGVGNKTKNCVLAEIYGVPLLAVDTHVQRISKRLGLVNENDSVLEMENKLVKKIPTNRLIKTNHQIIWFGRTICLAKSPKCSECKLQEYCKENHLK